jgi:hypothetical protein
MRGAGSDELGEVGPVHVEVSGRHAWREAIAEEIGRLAADLSDRREREAVRVDMDAVGAGWPQ